VDLEPIGSADQASGRVDLHQTVAAGLPRVWEALTSAAGLTAWLGRPQGPVLGPGVRFGLWHEDQVRSEHEVLQWTPLRLLVLTWDFPGEPVSRVRLGLHEHGTGSAVALEHQGVPDAVAYAAGWHVHLDFLAEVVAGRPRSFGTFWDDYEALLRNYGRHAR